jgi:hypothetical protein
VHTRNFGQTNTQKSTFRVSVQLLEGNAVSGYIITSISHLVQQIDSFELWQMSQYKLTKHQKPEEFADSK